jgi:hypothetical protein
LIPLLSKFCTEYRQETEKKGKSDTGKWGEIGMKKREGRKGTRIERKKRRDDGDMFDQ